MQVSLEILQSPVVASGIFVAGATAVLALYNQWQKARGAYAIPQPMRTKEDAEYVERSSYYKHCELNRLAHEQISTEVKAVDARHNALAREVSALTESNRLLAARVAQMDHKIDRLLTIASRKTDED